MENPFNPKIKLTDGSPNLPSTPPSLHSTPHTSSKMSANKDIQMLKTQVTALEASNAALVARVQALEAAPIKATKTKAKKESTGEKREQSEGAKAWRLKVEATVADMRANGWESWTDVSGNTFAGSKPATVDGRETHVFTDSGKEPVYPNGLKRASYLDTKDSPEKLAKTKARADKRAATVAAKKAPASEAEAAPKAEKPKRVLSEEHKAKMKAGREAKKAAPAEVPEVVAEVVPEVAEKPAAKPKTVAKKAKVYDLNFNGWTFNGEDYISNERGDVLTMEGDWVGRFNGKIIDEKVERPTDIDEFLSTE